MFGPSIRVNPAIKAEDYVETYNRDGYVQIRDFFEVDVAESITSMFETSVDWDLSYLDNQQHGVVLSRQQIAQLGREELQRRLLDLNKRAGSRMGMLYSGYGMITAYKNGRDPGHPIHKLTEFVCGQDFIDFGRIATGQPQINKADAQATYYRPGDFIGLHDDTASEDGLRLTAYTLGFTRRWRSDWGGQLILHDERGDIERGLVPRWNTLTMFKVPRLHSVAPVAAYAQAPRISVVGWLRDDSPPPEPR